ncbi:MAG: PA0069 family radical SAM protein [Pseudomonadota bacterium]
MYKGRGAASNIASSRFDDKQAEMDGDWRDEQEQIDGKQPRPRTQVHVEKPRTIITRNKSPDIPFDRSINAYRGCEHGCIYCYARPTHAYHNLSPGLDFETQLFAKPNAADLLLSELAKPGYTVQPLAIGTNTDPYQPIEGRYRITRSILQVCLDTLHPIGITTKSNRITDDIDLLTKLARRQLTAVAISITTLDGKTARIMEPRAPSPYKRLDAVRRLSAAGIFTNINIAPIIPAITDHELEAIAMEAAKAGAKGIAAIPVRLPHEVAPLFEEWLDAHYPDRAKKVMSIIKSLRGGRKNDPRFFNRFRGQGPWAELLATRMTALRYKYGMNKTRYALRTDLFTPPRHHGAQGDFGF